MAPRNPTPYGRALAVLRHLTGTTQARLARKAGLRKPVITAWEGGRLPLLRDELDRLAALMGCGPDDVEAVLLREETRPDPPESDLVAPSPAVRRVIRKAKLSAARAVLATTGDAFTRRAVDDWARQHRGRAAAHWERVRRHPAEEWREQIDETPACDAWALAELLCAASEKAAAADAGKALFLADLALHTAGRVDQTAAWRSRNQGACWAYVGNARRVAGTLVLADQGFEESERLWKEGERSDPGILDAGRLLDMKASLRCAQRRFDEALKLHEGALALTPLAKRGYILLNMSKLHEERHQHEDAIEVLERALSVINPIAEPRLALVARFNLIVNLYHLERYAEAEKALPEVREMALELGNALDLVRLLWLTGWVASGLGKSKDAIVALDQVRREFAERAIDYDMALASLDLAVLHLKSGKPGKVKEIALAMKPIFDREQVHREALAALKVFCDAALQESATVEQVRRIYEYLNESKHDTKRRFEG